MNRGTWMGRLMRRDHQAARFELTILIRRHHGQLDLVSVEMGVNKRTVERWVWTLSLWEEVDKARATRPPKDRPSLAIERARVALAGARKPVS